MNAYDKDINAWAQEQARLLRAVRFELLDIEHIAHLAAVRGCCAHRAPRSGNGPRV